jgi:hypothetical protein
MDPDAFVRNRQYANLLTARYLRIVNSQRAATILAGRVDELIGLLEAR